MLVPRAPGRPARRVAAALALALAVAGCGSDAATAPAPSVSTAATPGGSAAGSTVPTGSAVPTLPGGTATSAPAGGPATSAKVAADPNAPRLDPAALQGQAVTVGGQSVDLATLANKDLVVWFWAPW